jgi:hypothetical protein
VQALRPADEAAAGNRGGFFCAIAVIHRMRHLFLIAAILQVLARPAMAQAPPVLDASVQNFQLPRQLPPCGLEAVLQRLAKETGVRVGIERPLECDGRKTLAFPQVYKPLDLAGAEVLDGVRLKDVLGRLAALVPDYDWAIMDGVVVFRPSDAWKDARSPLAARVPAIHFSEAPLGRVMAAILNLPVPGTPGHHMSIDFPGGTVLEALNALVRSQPAMWHAIPDGEKLFVSVMNVPARSGLHVSAPVPGLISRRLP